MSFITVKFGGKFVVSTGKFLGLIFSSGQAFSERVSLWLILVVDNEEELFNPNCVTVNLLDNLRRRCGCQKGSKSAYYVFIYTYLQLSSTVCKRCKSAFKEHLAMTVMYYLQNVVFGTQRNVARCTIFPFDLLRAFALSLGSRNRRWQNTVFIQ